MDDVIAAAPPVPDLVWYFRALGIRYTLWLPLTALFSLALVALVCFRVRNGNLTALLVLIIPLPLLLGMYSFVDGWVAVTQVVALSGATPRPSEMVTGMAMSVASVQVGLWLMLPSFVLATAVMVYRALTSPFEAPELPVSLVPPGK